MEIQQTIIYMSFISSNLGFKTMVQFKCFVGIITGITMHLSYLNLLSYESSLYFSWMYSNVIETWEGSRVSSEELLHTPPCDLLTVVPVQRNGGLWTSFAITVNVGSRQLALEVLVLPQSLVVPGEPAQSAVLDKPPPLLCLMPLIPETHIWLWSCCPASFSADPKSRFFPVVG